MRVLIGRVGVFGLRIAQGGGVVAAGLAEPAEVEALQEGRSLLIVTERKVTSTLRSPATRSASPDRRSPRYSHIGQAPCGMPTASPPPCPPKIGNKSARFRTTLFGVPLSCSGHWIAAGGPTAF